MLKIDIDSKSAQIAVNKLEKDLKSLGRSTDKSSKEWKALESRLRRKVGADQAKRSIDGITKSLKMSRLETMRFKMSVGDLGGAFRSFTGILGKVKGTLFSMKTMMAGIGLAVVFGDIIRVGTKFEQTMAGVKGVTGASAKEFTALTGIAKKLGETTEFTASQAAEGLKFLAMAGFEVDKAIAALPGTLNLATAGQLELGEAADITTNALTAMRLDVEQLGMVNDTFVKTITTSNTDIRMLAESFKYAAPLAAGLGYDIKELSALIGLLGNAGIQGSMAGTQLNVAFQRLPNLFSKYGETIKRADGSTKGLADAIELLEKHGATAEEVMKLFAARGGRAMLAFLGMGSRKMREYQILIENSAGAAKKLADTMRNTTVGAFKELTSAIEGVKISAFESQTGDLNEIIKELTGTIRDNKDEILTFINALAFGLYEAGKAAVSFMSTFGKLFKVDEILFPMSGIEVMEKMFAKAKEEARDFEKVLRSSGRVTEDQIEIALKPYNDEISRLSLLLAKARVVFKEVTGAAEGLNEVDLAKVQIGVKGIASALQKEEFGRLENLAKFSMVKIEAPDIVSDIRAESEIQKLDRDIAAFDKLQTELHEEGKKWKKKEEKEQRKALDKGLKYARMIEMDSWQKKLEMSKEFTEQRIKIEKERYEKEKEALEESLRWQEEIYKNFLEGIQTNFSDTFYDMLSGQLKSWDKYVDRMKESFIHMLSDMAAKAAMTKLFGDGTGGLSSKLLTGSQFAQGPSGQGMEWVGTLGAYGMAAYAGFTFGQMIGKSMGLGETKEAEYRFSRNKKTGNDWMMLAQQTGEGYTSPTELKSYGSKAAGKITDALEDMYQGYVDQANILSNITGAQGDIVFKPGMKSFKMKNAEFALEEIAGNWADTLWKAFDDAFEKMGFKSMEAVIKGISREKDALGNAFQGALESGSWLLFKSNIAEQIYNTISQDLTNQLVQSKAIQGALMPVYGQIEKAMTSATAGGGFDLGLFRQGISGVGGLLSTSFADLKPAFNEIAGIGKMIREMFVGTFQSGGVVPKTGLAMVHEGETITPENAPSVSVVVQGNVWGTDLTSIIVEALEEANITRWGRPLQRYDLQTAGINVS